MTSSSSVTLPKKGFVLFQPTIRRGGYQQQKPVPGGRYHIAVSFRSGAAGAVSLCHRATVDKVNGYRFLISWQEVVKYEKDFTELICQRCRKALL